MIRRDVKRLADNLAGVSQINPDHVYSFLLDVGMMKGCNPCKLDFVAGRGVVFLAGERDSTYIERYVAPEPWTPTFDGPDYEDLILARQERYLPDP